MYFRNVQSLASNSDFGALKATITEVLGSRDGIYGLYMEYLDVQYMVYGYPSHRNSTIVSI